MARGMFGFSSWLFCCCFAAPVALAEPAALSSQALNETVAGAVIELDTPIGTKLPMRFGSDGLVSGEAGVLATFLGAAKDRGRWWVANDRLCIKWFRWFSSEPRCMEIRADGSRIFWRQDDGDTGTATLKSAPAMPKAKPPAELAATTTPPPADRPARAPVMAAAIALPTPAVTPSQPPTPVVSASPAPDVGAPVKATPATTPLVATTVEVAKKVAPRTAGVIRDRAKAPEHIAQMPPAKPAISQPASSTEYAAQRLARVARVDDDDMLNVRSGPSEYHEAVGIISPRGRGLIVTGACVADWCPIRHGKISGWVNRYYLTEDRARR